MTGFRHGCRAAVLAAAAGLLTACAATGGAPLEGGPANDTQAATQGMQSMAELEIVDCLLPGQVRQLGNMTYLTARRPVHTTASDCRIRGGEYVAYDRANYKSALNVWMGAAQAGDAKAQNYVGEIFERGLGTAPDYAAAALWYQKAAAQGYGPALFNLGTLYERGLGVPRNRLKALNLYREAWGIPADNVIFASAARREEAQLRGRLEKVIAEKDEQLKLLDQQLGQLERQARKHAATRERSREEIGALRSWIARLRAERRSSANQLAKVAGEERGVVATGRVVPLDLKAQKQLVGGLDFGRYYALIIANQDYQHLPSLATPRTDADRVAQLLRDKYGFTVKVVDDAYGPTMLRALNDLNRVLKPTDNLLIYYAGHGTRLKTPYTEVGYWLPINANPPPNDTFWVPNGQISAQLGVLPARRILVIADSCYAGLLSSDPSMNIFGTEKHITDAYIKYKLPKRSRLLIASGGDEPVLDEGGDGDSVFTRAFLEVLRSNDEILSTPALYTEIKARMKREDAANHFDEVPQFKAIRAAGDDLGDFFFIPRGLGPRAR
jgi:hypothetical protein